MCMTRLNLAFFLLTNSKEIKITLIFPEVCPEFDQARRALRFVLLQTGWAGQKWFRRASLTRSRPEHHLFMPNRAI